LVHGQRISFVSVTHICMHGMVILVDGASHGCSLGTLTCNCIDIQVDKSKKPPTFVFHTMKDLHVMMAGNTFSFLATLHG
jgi:hypothetical protein